MNWLAVIVIVVMGEAPTLDQPRMFASKAECESFSKMRTRTRPNWLWTCVDITNPAGRAI